MKKVILLLLLASRCFAADDAALQYLHAYYGLIYPFGDTLGGATIFGYGSYDILTGVKVTGTSFGSQDHFTSLNVISLGYGNSDLGSGGQYNSIAIGNDIVVSLPSTAYFGNSVFAYNFIETMPASGFSNYWYSLSGTNLLFNSSGLSLSGVPYVGNWYIISNKATGSSYWTITNDGLGSFDVLASQTSNNVTFGSTVGSGLSFGQFNINATNVFIGNASTPGALGLPGTIDIWALRGSANGRDDLQFLSQYATNNVQITSSSGAAIPQVIINATNVFITGSNTAAAFVGTNQGASSAFTGNGPGLTNLNGANLSGGAVTNQINSGGTVGNTGGQMYSLVPGSGIGFATNGAGASATLTPSVSNAPLSSLSTNGAGPGTQITYIGYGNVAWANDTNSTINTTFLPTNFVLNQVYTNNAGTVQYVQATALLTMTGVAGNASLGLMVSNSGAAGYSFASVYSNQTLITSLAAASQGDVGAMVSNGACYYYSNSSSGAGDSSSIVSGTGSVTTLGNAAAGGGGGSAGPFTNSGPTLTTNSTSSNQMTAAGFTFQQNGTSAGASNSYFKIWEITNGPGTTNISGQGSINPYTCAQQSTGVGMVGATWPAGVYKVSGTGFISGRITGTGVSGSRSFIFDITNGVTQGGSIVTATSGGSSNPSLGAVANSSAWMLQTTNGAAGAIEYSGQINYIYE